MSEIILFLLSYIPNSRIKTIYYKIKGANIGKNFSIGIGSFIRCSNYDKITIGRNVNIMDKVIIDVNELSIGNNTSIGFGTIIKGKGILNIGDQSYIGTKSYLDTSGGIYIGNEVGTSLLGGIFTHDYSATWFNEGVKFKYFPVTIGDRTWIGPGTIISGAKIGSVCLIGAKSFITNDINDNSVVAGNPCKVIIDNNRIRKFSSNILLQNDFKSDLLSQIQKRNKNYRVYFLNNFSKENLLEYSKINKVSIIFSYGFNGQLNVPKNVHIYDLDMKLLYNKNFKFEKYITGYLRQWGIFIHYGNKNENKSYIL